MDICTELCHLQSTDQTWPWPWFWVASRMDVTPRDRVSGGERSDLTQTPFDSRFGAHGTALHLSWNLWRMELQAKGDSRASSQHESLRTQEDSGLRIEGPGGGEERLGLQLGELLLHRAWQWGWAWDIRRQGTAQGAELKAIASLHTRVSPSLKSVLWGPHLPHPSSSHLNENVTTSWGMRPLSCPGESCPQHRAACSKGKPCPFCLTHSANLFSLINLPEAGSAVLRDSGRRLGVICGQGEITLN